MTVYINGRYLTQRMTGVQRFAHEITRELLARRDDAVVLAPAAVPLDADYDLPPARLRLIGTRAGHAWEQIDLPRHLRARGRPLLVTLASTAPAFYRNQVVTHHDITYVRHPESFSRAFRFAYGMLVPRMLSSARRVITVSEFSADEISRHYGVPAAKISVVPNAPAKGFSPGTGPTDLARPYLLAASSPNVHKNFARLTRAYASIDADARPDLVIVGAQARAFTATTLDGVDVPGIRHLGRVSDARLVELYRGALAFVFPSVYEGFGIPPLEAQACDCPVVASDIPVLRHVLRDSAEFFDPLDETSMAASVRAVTESAERREALRTAGLRNVRRFSWHRSAGLVDDVITDMLAESDTSDRASAGVPDVGAHHAPLPVPRRNDGG